MPSMLKVVIFTSCLVAWVGGLILKKTVVHVCCGHCCQGLQSHLSGPRMLASTQLHGLVLTMGELQPRFCHWPLAWVLYQWQAGVWLGQWLSAGSRVGCGVADTRRLVGVGGHRGCSAACTHGRICVFAQGTSACDSLSASLYCNHWSRALASGHVYDGRGQRRVSCGMAPCLLVDYICW